MLSLPLLSSLALSCARICPRSITSTASRDLDASLPQIIYLQLRVFLAKKSLFLRHLSIVPQTLIFWELAIGNHLSGSGMIRNAWWVCRGGGGGGGGDGSGSGSGNGSGSEVAAVVTVATAQQLARAVIGAGSFTA